MESPKESSGRLEERLALILARLELEASAAQAALRLASGNDYCDFFVENNNGGPFHEKCPDDKFLGLEIRREQFSQRRMNQLKALRNADQDSYSDFFVEGSGPPWHEKIEDYDIREQLVMPEQRAFALRRSSVIQAFTRIAEQVIRSGF
jgi:hypothetical protein